MKYLQNILRHCFIFISLVVAGSAFCSNIEHVKIGSYYIPGLVENKSEGLMVEMLKRIERIEPISFDLTLMPTVRVQENFKAGVLYSYFPELEEYRHKPSCRTSAFMQKKIIAVTRKGEPVIKSINDLVDKRVGAVAGYSYGLDIVNNKGIKLQRVKNDEINIKKLLAGRIDVIVGDIHSTVEAIKKTRSVEKVVYDTERPIDLLDVFFVFPDHAFGRVHCEQVSKGIETLRQQGDLLRWFGYQ